MARLRISFDLDDTLICYREDVPREKCWASFFLPNTWNEPLREGTVALFRELEHRNCDIWIYTTSFRSERKVRSWLWFYGLRVHAVINQNRHQQAIERHPNSGLPSKNPKLFDIDLHIDDEQGVQWEGEEHGFNVLVISPDDVNWTSKVKTAVDEFVIQC